MLPLSEIPWRAWTLGDTESSIPQRFAHIVEEYPQHIACRTRDITWTYADLNTHAQTIAAAILAVRGDTLQAVALWFEQGAWVSAATLGTLMARKIYVPLDPAHPPARIQEVLLHADVTLVLTDTAHQAAALAVCAAGGIRVVNIETLHNEDMPPARLPESSPDLPAYLYYTSGSTGKPKGVLHSHQTVLHTVLRYTNQLHISANDRLTLFQAPAFSGAVSSFFCAVLNGGTSYPIAMRAENPDALAEWLITERVTMMHAVPALFRSLLRQGRTFPDVRVIRLEGDRATRTDADLRAVHFSPKAVLVNGLGTTETNLVCQYFVDGTTRLEGNNLPLGYPVPDMRVLILDAQGQAAGTGVSGEIGVASRYLALGYWKDTPTTAQKFLPDPQDASSRIYRTGDLGRLRADGCLEYWGRTDFRVKVRGQFVDPSEIEAELLNLNGVAQAAVVARANAWGETELVAFLVAGGLSADQIRAHLSARLAEAVLPNAIVFIAALPLTDNGKLDRRALQTQAQERVSVPAEPVLAQTETQAKLAKIWQDVLGVGGMGVRTRFLDVGGDSLRAFQILARVSDTFRARLSPQEFFAAPTIEGQAQLLDNLPPSQSIPAPRIPRRRNQTT